MSANQKQVQATQDTSIQPRSESSLAPRTINVVTMSKGGVGKSLISWTLAQWLNDRSNEVGGRQIRVIDLDPMTHSLAQFGGLGVKSVDLLHGEQMAFNGPAVDGLAEAMIEGEEDYVLDNGAAGFTGLTRYLADNEFPALLGEHKARLVIHAVLGGGSASVQCLTGLGSLLEAFDEKVRFVAWVNEHEGAFVVNGKRLEEMTGFQDNKARFLGVVHLKRLSEAFLGDFSRMREEGLTFSEAIASPKFFLMSKQRLTVVRRELWAQLDRLGLV